MAFRGDLAIETGGVKGVNTRPEPSHQTHDNRHHRTRITSGIRTRRVFYTIQMLHLVARWGEMMRSIGPVRLAVSIKFRA